MNEANSWFYAFFCITFYCIVVMAILYGCTFNIVQTSSNARAKEVAEIFNKDDAQFSLEKNLP